MKRKRYTEAQIALALRQEESGVAEVRRLKQLEEGIDVVQVLEKLVTKHGLPGAIRVDNGPEFISKDVDLRAC